VAASVQRALVCRTGACQFDLAKKWALTKLVRDDFSLSWCSGPLTPTGVFHFKSFPAIANLADKSDGGEIKLLIEGRPPRATTRTGCVTPSRKRWTRRTLTDLKLIRPASNRRPCAVLCGNRPKLPAILRVQREAPSPRSRSWSSESCGIVSAWGSSFEVTSSILTQS
jgi:hypothetical protein